MGEWVRYKLDRRTDHILVDEAQDTNAAQWEIVEALAAEYFSGLERGRAAQRTMFMVGDFKQAIFGFQGTDPQRIRAMRATASREARSASRGRCDGRRATAAREFRDLSIDASFRSAPAVLDVVDAVIAEVGHERDGPAASRPTATRASCRPAGPGRAVAAVRGRRRGASDEGEEGWLGESERRYADAAGAAGPRMARRGAGAGQRPSGR